MFSEIFILVDSVSDQRNSQILTVNKFNYCNKTTTRNANKTTTTEANSTSVKTKKGKIIPLAKMFSMAEQNNSVT